MFMGQLKTKSHYVLCPAPKLIIAGLPKEGFGVHITALCLYNTWTHTAIITRCLFNHYRPACLFHWVPITHLYTMAHIICFSVAI